ncbi:MAG: CPBP family intramembrane glutamic endopeptidase [Rhizomicrobium sp.]|jgi:hypothetical protein
MPWPLPKGAKLEHARAQMQSAGLLVRDAAQFGAFVPTALLVGCGAEIFFRGFLLWVFSPIAGVAVAVVIAGLAYGLGHGFTSRRQLIGSIVSAFVFTIAYAVTASLWWLMLIHAGFALQGSLMGWRISRAQPAWVSRICLMRGPRRKLHTERQYTFMGIPMKRVFTGLAIAGLAALMAGCVYYPHGPYGPGYGPAPPPGSYGPPPGDQGPPPGDYGPPPGQQPPPGYGPQGGGYGPPPQQSGLTPQQIQKLNDPQWCAQYPHRCKKLRDEYAAQQQGGQYGPPPAQGGQYQGPPPGQN